MNASVSNVCLKMYKHKFFCLFSLISIYVCVCVYAHVRVCYMINILIEKIIIYYQIYMLTNNLQVQDFRLNILITKNLSKAIMISN